MGIFKKIVFKVFPSSIAKQWQYKDIEKEFLVYKKNDKALQEQWKTNRSLTPVPHIAKEEMILKYAKQFDIGTFVETGTYLGLMIESMKNNFKELYSIELSPILYERAKNKFSNNPNIHLLNGDSGILLKELLTKLDQNCLFWLDGHFSGGVTEKADIETPIIAELNCILAHKIKNHIILIDDAQLFNGTRDYPTTQYLQNHLQNISPDFIFEIESDIILIYRKDNKN